MRRLSNNFYVALIKASLSKQLNIKHFAVCYILPLVKPFIQTKFKNTSLSSRK